MKKPPSKDPVFKLAKKRVNSLLKATPTSGENLSDEQVHELRVCTKNLRALVQLYRPVCSKQTIKVVEQAIKQLADTYSHQRDSHVQYTLIYRTSQAIGQQHQQLMQPLLSYFLMLKKQTKEQSTSHNSHAELKNILQLWQDNLVTNQVVDLKQGVDFTYQKSRKLAQKAMLTGKDDAYHQCRKWVKYYVYQLRVLAPKKHIKGSKYIKQLTALGDVLGGLHDHCVLEQTLNDLLLDNNKQTMVKAETPAMKAAIEQVLAWLAEQKSKGKVKSHRLFKRLFEQAHNPVKL